MKICPKCQFINDKNSKVCQKCNNDLTAIKAVGSAKNSKSVDEILKRKTCPKCGYVNKGDDIIKCKQCTRDLTLVICDSEKKTIEDLIEEQARPKMPLALRIVLAVLLSMYNIPVIALTLIKLYHEGFLIVLSIIMLTILLYFGSILFLIAPVKLLEWNHSLYKFISSFRQHYAAPNSFYPFWFKIEKIIIFVLDILMISLYLVILLVFY